MIIKNAKAVFENKILKRDIKVENGKITKICERAEPSEGEKVYDIKEAYLMPGFIDTHIHGALGESLYINGADIKKVLEFELKNGVTTVAPTLCMAEPEDIKEITQSIVNVSKENKGCSKIGGIHLEGPFLNMNKKGGMKPQWILKPSAEIFFKMYDACLGLLRIMTIAPETEGAELVISEALKKGIVLSAGHTEASFSRMQKAVDMGVTRLTHTFNAMSAFSHRSPGVLGVALTDKRVSCEVICDFAHLAPAAVELVYKMKGSSNFTAVSDSDFAAGMPCGEIFAADRKFIIKDGVGYLEDGTIAGSTGNLYTGFLNLCSLGIPLWEVSEMVSKNPAKALGIFDNTGSIEIGKAADFVALDNSLNIKNVFTDGKEVLL